MRGVSQNDLQYFPFVRTWNVPFVRTRGKLHWSESRGARWNMDLRKLICHEKTKKKFYKILVLVLCSRTWSCPTVQTVLPRKTVMLSQRREKIGQRGIGEYGTKCCICISLTVSQIPTRYCRSTSIPVVFLDVPSTTRARTVLIT